MPATMSPTLNDWAFAQPDHQPRTHALRRWTSRRAARIRRSLLYRLVARLLRVLRRWVPVVFVLAVVGGGLWAATTQYAEQRTRSSSSSTPSAAPDTSAAGGSAPGQKASLTRTGGAELERQGPSASAWRPIPSAKAGTSPSAISGLPGRAVQVLISVVKVVGTAALLLWPLIPVAALGLAVIKVRRARKWRFGEEGPVAVEAGAWWNGDLDSEPGESRPIDGVEAVQPVEQDDDLTEQSQEDADPALTDEQSPSARGGLRPGEAGAEPASPLPIDTALPGGSRHLEADDPVEGQHYTFDRPQAAEGSYCKTAPKVMQRTRILGPGGLLADDPAQAAPRRIPIAGSAIWSRSTSGTDLTPVTPTPRPTAEARRAANPALPREVVPRSRDEAASSSGAPSGEKPLRRPSPGPRTFRTGRSVPAPNAPALAQHLMAELEQLRERNRLLEQQVSELQQPAAQEHPAQEPRPARRKWFE